MSARGEQRDRPGFAWFEAAFGAPTEVQRRGWEAIARGEHALLIAPTGSGKTLAAFLWCIDRLCVPQADAERQPARGIKVVYVSPLKALVHDVERNLRVPLHGIRERAERRGEPVHVPRVSLRTGDTPAKERREQARDPGEILVTTPESLYLLLGSRAREHLRSVETVIVDEVHALAGEKRGAHLALSLERLSALCAREPQRIGLSATARPLSEVARFLGGDRPVTIVDATAPPRIDLQICVPVRDMSRPDESPPAAEQAPPSTQAAEGSPQERGLWPAIVPRLLALIREHKSTIVFVNSRGLSERLAHRINELAGEPLVRAHHGSLAHAERSQIEELLKRGAIAGIVATSSLELGIDMGAVELVLLVESPGSVARGLQRVGRAGHGVGQVSKGRLFPKHRSDLLEATVIARAMSAGAIEALRVPENPLDVLAQQIVAMVAVEDWALPALAALVRRSANFQRLPETALLSVLDLLAGRYPSHDFRDLRARLTWDRERGMLKTRRGAALIALVNGGTIPDRGTYGVYLGEGGPRLGELDEEMVHETMPGEVFTLGASSFRVERITRDRVLVSHAPGEAGKLPFWRGEGPGRPIELGRALGAFVRDLGERGEQDALGWLMAEYGLDELAAQNLWAYVSEQRATTGCLPSDRAITIERFRDELGDLRVCILSPFGARVHAPWALALEARLGKREGVTVQTLYTDDGIVLRFAGGDAPPELERLLVPAADELTDLVTEQLESSALFAGLFRENAARALLLPRRHPTARVPLFLQRRRAAELLSVARGFPSFPIILETYRSCLKDVFDLPALGELLAAIERREVRVDSVETPRASPFAEGLTFAYVASHLYDGDAPLAERRATALGLDQRLLRELLGEAALRELLDPEVIAEVEDELQGVAEERRARSADALHELLRRVGDLDERELAQRCDGPAAEFLAQLEREARAVRIRIAGQVRAIAVEDAALYRDALGIAPPAAVPSVFLAGEPEPLRVLVERYARTHGPFTAAEVAHRFGWPERAIDAALELLAQRGGLTRGELRPGGSGTEACDSEVLRRIKRRTLARLRDQVAPVPNRALVRFLPVWHGIERGSGGAQALPQVIAQLEGLALPFGELERVILPARVPDFTPAMLDELGATGTLVWVGRGALPGHDGRIQLFLREQAPLLLDPPPVPDDLGPLPRALLAHLAQRGASFFTELQQAAAPAPTSAVLDALVELMWAGLVTNDTFRPLRVLSAPRSKSPRVQARTTKSASSGRFSLVSDLVRARPAETQRAHARAIKLLERHGLCTREVAELEELPGGFSATYSVFKALEELGKIRRGYFVESLGGAQFAYPGAVDRLRMLQDAPPGPALALSAVDPANPFGWLLPWPAEADDGAAIAQKPRRVAGALVVLAAGEPVLYLGSGGKHMLTFPAARDPAHLEAAVGALRAAVQHRRGKFLRVEQIDGRAAQSSELAPRLLALRFTSSYRGLELEG